MKPWRKALVNSDATLEQAIGVLDKAALRIAGDGAEIPDIAAKPLDLGGHITANAKSVTLNDLSIRFGETRGSGAIAIDQEPSLSADVALRFNQLDLDSILVLENDGSRLSGENRTKSLENAILSQLEKPGRAHDNKRKLSRQMRQLDVPTKVRFFTLNDESTLIELEALLITLLSCVLATGLLAAFLLLLRDYLVTHFGLSIELNLFTKHSFYLMTVMVSATVVVAAIPSFSGYRQAKIIKD